MNIADTNLAVNFDVNGDLNQQFKDINLDLEIENADLHALKLSPEQLELNTNIILGLQLKNEKNFSADLKIPGVEFHYSDTLYEFHPALLNIAATDTSTYINLESYFYNFYLEAADSITGLIDELIALPDYYLSDSTNDSSHFALADFKIHGQLDYPEAFARLFFPDLPSFEVLELEGSHHRMDDDINLNLQITNLNYNSVLVDSLLFKANGSSEKLDFSGNLNIEVDQLLSGNLNLSGSFDNSELISHVRYEDSYLNPYLDITAKIASNHDNLELHIIPDQLIFSYEDWDIHSENKVIINPTFIALENFELTNLDQWIGFVFHLPHPGKAYIFIFSFQCKIRG